MNIKNTAAETIGFATSFYFRNAPWRAGKRAAFDLFTRYVGWRPRMVTTRTMFGDAMEVQFPDFVSRIIYLTGQWEPAITRYVRNVLKPGDTFVDVGANLGYYTLLASSLVTDSGRVIAIEASPSIAARLRRNVEINGRKNVEIYSAAVAEFTGELPLFDGQDINLGHTTTVASIAAQEQLQAAGTVRADTLENLAGRDAIIGARLIKIDVEGAELAVLRSTFALLSSSQAEWLLELTPNYCAGGQTDVDTIFSGFIDAGYKAFAIPNRYTPDFIVNPADESSPLQEAPKAQCDVLMTKDVAGAAMRLRNEI